jgi:hypothetical protein
MQCTSCSAVVKPVVAVDIDGTLGDYHGHFLAFADAYLDAGRAAGHYDGSVPFRTWFQAQYNVDERTWRDIKLAYRQGAQKRSMPIKYGACDLTGAVRAAGAELWLTTTRPYMRLDNVDPDTRAWLDRHHIAYDHMIYDEEKYPVLAGLVIPERVVAVLDDLSEQLQSAAAVFGPDVPIMAGSPYNRGSGGVAVARTRTLFEARDVIVERIERWKAEHD